MSAISAIAAFVSIAALLVGLFFAMCSIRSLDPAMRDHIVNLAPPRVPCHGSIPWLISCAFIGHQNKVLTERGRTWKVCWFCDRSELIGQEETTL